MTPYSATLLQTISNPDGTVSIIHVDSNNPIITLPDGTTAQVQGIATVSCHQSLLLLLIRGGVEYVIVLRLSVFSRVAPIGSRRSTNSR